MQQAGGILKLVAPLEETHAPRTQCLCHSHSDGSDCDSKVALCGDDDDFLAPTRCWLNDNELRKGNICCHASDAPRMQYCKKVSQVLRPQCTLLLTGPTSFLQPFVVAKAG